MAKPESATAGAAKGGANDGKGNETESANNNNNDNNKPLHGGQDPQQQQQLTDVFVAAFDKQRSTLAGFARCSNLQELHVVRDGFYLGMAKDLCPDEYKRVLVVVLKRKFGSNGSGSVGGFDTGIVEGGNQGMLSMSFEEMVLAARACDDDFENDVHADGETNSSGDAANDDETKGSSANAEKDGTSFEAAADATTENTEPRRCYWKDLLGALFRVAETVGSDLESIWKTLEDGRMNWLRAVSAAHPVKVVLQKALAKDNNENANANASDAMMVWIYTLCVHLVATTEEADTNATVDPTLKQSVDNWVVAVNMTDRYQPLKGYQSELWDPRRDEWRPLDIGAQEAAERGGADLLEAWKA
eukprot:jgi/Psemu1/282395/fgenesh1_pg.6_\